MKIVALDFETANNSYCSACALGVAIYNDGEIIDCFEWLIKPFSTYNYFTNSHIHHICEEDVINEKEFVFYYDALKEILDDAIIVAHNTMFDIKVLNNICDLYGLDHFNNYYLDTVYLSRRVYPELYNHRLNTVCEYLDIELNHHNGKSDAMGCLMIVLMVMQKYEIYDLFDLLNYLKINVNKNQ